MEKYYFKVLKTIVEIDYPSNTRTRDYINQEYSLMKCTPSSPDIVIHCKDEKLVLPEETLQLKTDFYKNKGCIYQHFHAFRREFWISYTIKDYLFINLYIPYNTSLKERFFSPFYEDLDITCLADFFHNPFLYCLQNISLMKGATMLHCSAFSYDNVDNVIALTGGGQCGKSSLVKSITENNSVFAFSEDFAFVDVDNNIAGLLHQTRVKFKDMAPGERRLLTGKMNDRIADFINRMVYKRLKKNNHSRHKSVKDYYSKAIDISQEGKLKYLYYLNRDTDVVDKERIDADSMTILCMQTIKEEFHNIESFTMLAEVMSDEFSNFKNLNDLLELTESVYHRCFSKVYCGLIWLRRYGSINDASGKLKELVM